MARRIAVLVNPAAGAGLVARRTRDVLVGLASRGDTLVVIEGESPVAARRLLARAVGGGLDAVVAVGGDGTVHTALQTVAGTSTPLGIVPLGTGNDAAVTVGVGRASIPEAVAIVLTGRARHFDVGRVRTAGGAVEYFLCVLSTGFDSAVNERANTMSWPPGTGRYLRAVVAQLRCFTPISYRATFDGEAMAAGAMLVSVGNGPRFGGGMQVCAGADLHDGLLDVVWVGPMSRRRLLAVLPKVYSGRHLADPAVDLRRVRELTLSAPGQVAYADGERVGRLPAAVSAVPDGVQVLVPR